VSPSAFLQKHSSSASTTTSNTNNSTSNLKQQWSPPRKARRYDDLEHKLEAAPLYVLVSTYLNYFVLILFGHLRDIMGKFFKPHAYSHLKMNQVSRVNLIDDEQ
jgi:serine palmitoyltransferase